MNIVHVIESSGGSADFVLYLVKYLPSHKHSIIYSDRTFGNRLEGVRRSYSEVNLIHWIYVQREIKPLKDLRAFYSLLLILKKTPADVYHLHSSKAGFLGRLVCFFLGKRNSIYTPNGLPFLQLDAAPFKRRIYVYLEKFASNLNGQVVSCSKSEAMALTKYGIKSTFINNGTPVLNSFAKTSVEAETLTIVTAGRIAIQKNPNLFNQIAKHFETKPNYRFVWIGSGDISGELIAGNITITGWKDHAEVLEMVNDSDIYISTASWEGLPFAVIEAMSLGKPLLLSNCVGNVDLVDEGKNGFTFRTVDEAAQKLEYFYKNRNILDVFGERSKQMIEESFSVTKMASQYEVVYQEIKNNKI